MKYGLNRINIRLFTQQVGWFNGKGFELHPLDSKIYVNKWHSLWSTSKYWLNILYLFKLSKLYDDLGEHK
jgi:hypothetical protein